MKFNERTAKRTLEGLRNAAGLPENCDPVVYNGETIGGVPRSYRRRLEMLRKIYPDADFARISSEAAGERLERYLIAQHKKQGEQVPLF